MPSIKFLFFGLIRKTRWPPRPLIDWDIFDFFSETAERNSIKLDRKQDLHILYQLCDFQVYRKTKMAALSDSSTKVALCNQVHDMWPFGPLVILTEGSLFIGLTLIAKKIASSTCRFASLAIDYEVVVWWLATYCTSLERETKNVDTLLQNTNFSIVHLSSQHSATMPTLSPVTTIKRETYNMRHTTSERPKKATFKWKRKREVVQLVFAQNGVEKNYGKFGRAMLFTPPTCSRAFWYIPWQRK